MFTDDIILYACMHACPIIFIIRLAAMRFSNVINVPMGPTHLILMALWFFLHRRIICISIYVFIALIN